MKSQFSFFKTLSLFFFLFLIPALPAGRHNSYFIIQVNAFTETTYYIHTDHLGSVVAVSDESGNNVSQTKYSPYGNTVVSSQLSVVSERKYTGQIADKNTTLAYYNARYYDPVLSRFVSADSVNDSQNRFAYVEGNPILRNDPSGNAYDIGGDTGYRRKFKKYTIDIDPQIGSTAVYTDSGTRSLPSVGWSNQYNADQGGSLPYSPAEIAFGVVGSFLAVASVGIIVVAFPPIAIAGLAASILSSCGPAATAPTTAPQTTAYDNNILFATPEGVPAGHYLPIYGVCKGTDSWGTGSNESYCKRGGSNTSSPVEKAGQAVQGGINTLADAPKKLKEFQDTIITCFSSGQLEKCRSIPGTIEGIEGKPLNPDQKNLLYGLMRGQCKQYYSVAQCAWLDD
ncbi:hypothetical protein MUP32_06875 [Candidatus Microgenomates bacterium]|nr:hypothetical protein [Candidatus Microgenomates bacterium]